MLLGSAIGSEKWVFVLAAAAAIIALQWPVEAALGFYTFLVPFGSVSVLGSGNSGRTLNWVVGALAFVALLVAGVARNRLAMPSRAVQLWLLFFSWTLLTTLWAVSPAAARSLLPTAAALVLLYAVAACWRITAEQLSLLSRLAVAGGFLASLLITYLYFSGVTYGTWTQTSRASLILDGRQANPNGVAAELLLPISIAVAWFLHARTWRGKLAALAAFGIMGCAGLLTMSRAFIVALAVMLCVYLWRLRLNRRLLALGSALLAILVVMPTTFFFRLKEALPTHGAGRLDIWSAGLSALKTHWLPGAGLNNFPVVYQAYAGYASVFTGFNRGSHNMYLNVAVELGIVGFVLMVSALYIEFRAVGRLRPSLKGLPYLLAISFEAACWGMLADAFFGDLLWTKPFWICWLFLALVVRVGREASAQAIQPAPMANLADEEQLPLAPALNRTPAAVRPWQA